MTKTSLRAVGTKYFCFAFAISLAAISLHAAELKEGRVTQIIKDVKLLPGQAAPRPAVVDDPVRAGTAVRTGPDSRTELTFSDLTIARLGANTIFSLDEGTRTIDLGGGAVLVRVPKNSGGAKISTSAVTAAITGTTMLAEFHKNSIFKFIMLEGESRITRAGHPEESVTLRGGQMLSGDPRKPLGRPVTVNVKKIIASSQLILDFGPLGSEALMAQVIAEQEALGNFPHDHFAFGTDVLDTIDQRIVVIQTSATPTPTPLPDKFGALETITSADLSIIDTGTFIQTDPSITRNGVTGFGKIYRGSSIDGPASAYLFGSTSAFDTASGFDNDIGSGEDRGAVFKFTSLQLNGDPMISTTDGETNLGLIGVNGITSGSSPAAFTFAGIRGLLLATQNGSITIGAGFSFSGLHDLTFYARGAESSLTLGAAISTTHQLTLYSGDDVILSGNVSTRDFRSFSGGNFNLTSASFNVETFSVMSGANVTIGFNAPFHTSDFLLQASGNIQVNDSLVVTQSAGDAGGGLSISLLAGGNINIGDDLRLTTESGGLEIGGNITVTAGGNLNVGGLFSLMTSTEAASGNGGNIQVTVGGTLRAEDLFFGANFAVSSPQGDGENVSLQVGGDLIVRRDDDGPEGENSGGISMEVITPVRQTVANGANITLNVGGNVVTDTGGRTSFLINNNINEVVNGANVLATIGGSFRTGDFSAELFNGGGTIGTGGNLTFQIGGDLTTSSFLAQISNSDGSIANGGNISLSIGGSWAATGDGILAVGHPTGFIETGGNITFAIDNSDGLIGSGGNIMLTVGGDLSAQGLDVSITNFNGDIGQNAGIDLRVTGDVNVVGPANLMISNYSVEFGDEDINGHSGAGTIGGNARIALAAGNFTADSLNAFIENGNGGSIGGSAEIKFTISGALTIANSATFGISNESFDNAAGSITGDAIIDVTAASISASGGLSASLFLDSTGDSHIGGDAKILFNVQGDLTSEGLAFFTISSFEFKGNGFGGMIGGEAVIDLSAANVSANSLLVLIGNSGGMIGENALINFAASGDITTQSEATFEIFNDDFEDETGGTIGGDATISLAARNVTANQLTLEISNFGGDIGGSAMINFNATGDVLTNGFDYFAIYNDDGAIGDDASISAMIGGNYHADGIEASIDNRNGTIGSGASITFNLSGDMILTGDAFFQILNNEGGEIGGGGDISVTTGGDFSARSIDVGINSRNGGLIDAEGNITFTVGGALTTTQADASFVISTRYDGISGGTIASDATLRVSADSVSIAGLLTASISSRSGGLIGGDVLNSFSVVGNLGAELDAIFEISNQDFANVGRGGTINGDAAVQVSAGDVSTGGDLLFRIQNNAAADGILGGIIDGNATIDVVASSLSSAGSLMRATIRNEFGSIGGNAVIDLAISGDVNAQGDASFLLTNAGGEIGGNASISATIGGNYYADGIQALIDNRNGTIGSSASIMFNVGGNLDSYTDAFFTIDNSDGGSIYSNSSIQVSANNITTNGDFDAYIDPQFFGSDVRIESSNDIHVGGRLNVFGSVISDGDVTAQTIAATSIDTQGGDIIAGSGGIRRFAFPSGVAPDVLHTLTARAVISDGGINFDGVGANALAAATSGGVLRINADSLFFDGEGDIRGSVTLNGGNGFLGFDAGSGGFFEVNTSGPISVNNDIEATTGVVPDGAPASGIGGTVNLLSTNDTVSVTSRIEVSSASQVSSVGPTPTPGPARRSARGGDIRLSSGKSGPVGGPRAVAIDVGSSSQLLALLDASAPGPGGKIVISATGANSDVRVRGRVRAERGLVDIRHTGDGGNVALEGQVTTGGHGPNGSLGTLDVHGDVVKVAALGTNGLLTIGNGTISADTTLQLYATGFNGEVRFVGNAILSGNSVKSIAGNAVTINNGIFVFVGGPAASVYVNSNGQGIPNANYTGFGGNGSTTGTFTGSGANSPQPLGQAPPLGLPPTRPGG